MPCKQHTELKKKARFLRKNGLSYKEIAEKIGGVKSTVKTWCADIRLKPEYQARLYTKQIERLSKGPKSSHERRKNEIGEIVKNAESQINLPLDYETYRLFGAALYWAEGDKTKQFAIANSDPRLIAFMVQWMRDILKKNPRDMKAHLNIYPQQNENEIKKFWAKITGIPLENFGKSFIKPISKGYKKNTLYYGTIKIRLLKGTDIRHRVFGWTAAVLKDVVKKVEISEKRWHKLKNYTRP